MGRLLNRVLSVLSLAVVLGWVSIVPAAPTALGAAGPLSPNPGTDNYLRAVSATSGTSAWAVGYYFNTAANATDTLVLHWNGTSWAKASSPNPSSTDNELLGVSATSATNAWAVGYYTNNKSGIDDTLILHWNGKTWSQMKSASPSASFNGLFGVSATSGANAWAVGYYCVLHCGLNIGFNTLLLRWNGTTWSRVTIPDPSTTGNGLSGVSATSTSNAWAAGYYINPATHATDTLTERWNGTAWSKVASANPNSTFTSLSGVSADSPTDAWAAGSYQISTPGTTGTFTEQWNGTAWSKAATPSPSPSSNYLFGVNANSGTDVWAVGRYCASGCGGTSEVDKTLLLHWNGSRWSKVSNPNPSSSFNELWGVSAVSAHNAWAVGDYCTPACSAYHTLILHWNGSTWTQT
jgi:hypothetical protein